MTVEDSNPFGADVDPSDPKSVFSFAGLPKPQEGREYQQIPFHDMNSAAVKDRDIAEIRAGIKANEEKAARLARIFNGEEEVSGDEWLSLIGGEGTPLGWDWDSLKQRAAAIPGGAARGLSGFAATLPQAGRAALDAGTQFAGWALDAPEAADQYSHFFGWTTNKASDSIRDIGDDLDHLAPNPRARDAYIGGKGAEVLAGTTPLAVSMAVSPPAGVALGMLSGAGAQYEEARAMGASDARALSAAVGGSIVGAVDAVSIGSVGHILARVNRKLGGTLMGTLVSRTAGVVAAGGVEFGTEGVQEVMSNTLARHLYDDERAYMAHVLEAAKGGGFAGLVFGSLGLATSGVKRRARLKYLRDIRERRSNDSDFADRLPPVTHQAPTEEGETPKADSPDAGASVPESIEEPITAWTVAGDVAQEFLDTTETKGRVIRTPENPFQEDLRKYSEEHGLEIAFVDAPGMKKNGMQVGDTVVINVSAGPEAAVRGLLYHEVFHSVPLDVKEAAVAELDRIAPDLMELVRERNRAAYEEEVATAKKEGKPAPEELTPAQKQEEAGATAAQELVGVLEALHENPQLLSELQTASPTLFRGLVEMVKNTLARMGIGKTTQTKMQAWLDANAKTRFEKDSALTPKSAKAAFEAAQVIFEALETGIGELTVQITPPKAKETVSVKADPEATSDERFRPTAETNTVEQPASNRAGPPVATATAPRAPVDKRTNAQIKRARQKLNRLESRLNRIQDELAGPLTSERRVELREELKDVHRLIAKHRGATPKRALTDADLKRRPNVSNADVLIDDIDMYGEEGMKFAATIPEMVREEHLKGTRTNAWHGTPHTFDKFDSSQIGTGEGVQAFGHGLYFGSRRGIAETYRKALTVNTERWMRGRFILGPKEMTPSSDAERGLWKVMEGASTLYAPGAARKEFALNHVVATIHPISLRKEVRALVAASRNHQKFPTSTGTRVTTKGHLLQVELAPREDEYLLWDEPISQQSDAVKEMLDAEGGVGDVISPDRGDPYTQRKYTRDYLPGKEPRTGKSLYRQLGKALSPKSEEMGQVLASEYLLGLGIRGNKYLDGLSREKGEGSYNYVLFNDADVEIKKRYASTIPEMLPSDEDAPKPKAAAPKKAKAPKAKPIPDAEVVGLSAPEGDFASVIVGVGSREKIIRELRRGFENEFADVERIQRFLGLEPGKSGELDVVAKERLVANKIAHKIGKLRQLEVKLKRQLRDQKLTREEADDYAIWRHGPDRNGVIADRNEAGGFGTEWKPGTGKDSKGNEVTSTYARNSYLAMDKKYGRGNLQPIVQTLYDILEGARAIQVESGVISQAQADAWVDIFGPEFVPLQDVEYAQDRSFPSTGGGHQVRGPSSKRAMGRTTQAGSPIVNTFRAAEVAVKRSEHNLVGRSLGEVVKANPNEMWEVTDKEPSSARVRLEKLHVLTYKVDGEPMFVVLQHAGGAGKLLHDAMSNMGVGGAHEAMRVIHGISGIGKALVTAWNPEFVLFSNPIKDVQTAMFNTMSRYPKMDPKRIGKGVFKAVYELTRYGNQERGEGGWVADTPYREDLLAWAEGGGKSSYIQETNYEATITNFDRLMKRGQTREAMHSFGEIVSVVSDGTENGTRLSVYNEARRVGMPHQDALFISRNATVDFGRIGKHMRWINSMYWFTNPSLQSGIQVMKAMTGPRGRAVVAGMAAAGFANDMLNSMAPPGEDGEDRWAETPQHIKDTHYIILLPYKMNFGLFKSDRIQIPIGWIWNVPYLAGQTAGAMVRGKDKTEATANLAAAALEAISPVGTAPTVAQLALPSLLDPVIQIAENTTWYDGTIRPPFADLNQEFEGSARSEVYRDSTVSPTLRYVTKWLNEAGGGNAERSAGVLDQSPADVAHILEFLGGGTGKFLGRSGSTLMDLLSGKDAPIEQMPFMRKLFGAPNPHKITDDFYDLTSELDTMKREAKNGYESPNPELGALIGYVNDYKARVKAANKAGDTELAQTLMRSFLSSAHSLQDQ
jgi:hypothetical protein